MAQPQSIHIDQTKCTMLLMRSLISVACTVGIACSGALPTFAQEIPITDQLAQAENKLIGRVDEKGSVEQRIGNLETKLFGKKSKGDMSSRLQKIWKALGASPQSSSTAAGSTSAANGSADSSSSAMDTKSHADASPSTLDATSYPSTVSSEDSVRMPAVQRTGDAGTQISSTSALHIVSGAAPTTVPWTADLNGNGLSEQDRAIAIVPPIDTTQTQDQQSKMLHVGVSKSEAFVAPTNENLKPLSDGDLLKRAKQLLSENRLAEARQILDYLVDRNIKCTEGYLLLGDISAHTGNSVDALRNYWLARNLDPANLILQNRVKGAESVIKGKVRTYHADSNYYPTPSDVRSVVNEGVRLWGLGCPEQASLMFEHAIKMDPNNVNAYFNLGAIAEWQGKYPEALNDYSHASACLNHQGPYPLIGAAGHPTTVTDVRHFLTGFARSVGVPYLQMPHQQAPPTEQYNKGAPYLSGGEDTTDIHMDVGQAIEDVRRKMQLRVAQMNIPTLPINQNFHTDTCDRCRILRTKAMGPD